jgi:hypothetical protein
MQNEYQAEPATGRIADKKNCCLLFCGLLLAYRKHLSPSECVQKIGLPRQYARLFEAA